ncbi:MAG: sigma-70 family RNA polymerase sigma factor [Verrucomicrobia bacterium]|jgi:RNA polymerase sigma-70 factor, ECF subfamily|nr:sigma-70 family RNA polymerase sigma factor [Verrucomicrobiota bacterium]MDA1204312.1 sigma-70 family RNA polymerase sigma factor [Verrucomicrobiota bacterium]
MITAPEPDDRAVELDLMARVAKRERVAFEQLYDRYSNILYATAMKFLREDADAQDVVQDVFIQIWDKAKLYDPAKGKPLTWALTLTRNRSIDRIRAIQRRGRLREDFEKETVVDESAGIREALSGVDASEKNQILRDAVQRLSPEQRKVIELAFFGGLTQNEVANRLGEPLGTVKARARRGLMKLKELLGTKP